MTYTITTRQKEELGAKVHEMLTGQKNDPSAVGSYGPYQHGNTGLFSTPGTDPQVFSAMLMPTGGLADDIPVMPAGTSAPEGYGGYDVPLYTIITGVTKGPMEERANQRATACGKAPEAGLVKACTQTAPYGLFSASLSMNMHKVGHLLNSGEPTNLSIVNRPPGSDFQVPDFLRGLGPAFFTELGKKLFESGMSFRRYVNSITYDASPANNIGDGYAEYVGVDLQVNTGKVDAIMGNLCPAVDSIIRDFGSQRVDVYGAGLVKQFDDIVRQIRYRSSRMGLGEPMITAYMRQEAFDEIVKYWPIQYYMEALAQISQYTNGRVSFNANETAVMRDDMRNNLFLPVRGARLRIVLDDTIPETVVGNGIFSSDIYFITKSVFGGGLPTVYWEAFNQNNAQARALEALTAGQTWTSDGGVFRWYSNHRNGCIELTWEGQWRMINRTTWLDARLQNVAYAPLYHLSGDWDPDSGYFLNGGRTNTNEQKWYTDWSTTTPVVVGGR